MTLLFRQRRHEMADSLFRTSQSALDRILQGNMIVKSKMKNSETFAAVHGFLLSNDRPRQEYGRRTSAHT
ncbi:hypothetical protein A3K71_07355 [archaeon RBG_16_50_20]|nr:MAG: hypothetical protein A3K71_07355 [archaeon RBG_16_50_20]